MAFQWLPEDDYLLRKSLEDGTSLETLAKGAVRFSRKFTLSELTERWHCLLYNPKVTSLSSSVGFELQYGAQFLPQSLFDSVPVRTHYYTTRKRRRLELEESLKVNNNAIDEHLNVEEGNLFGECDDDFGFKFEDIESFRNTFPDILLSPHDYQTTIFGNEIDDEDDRMVNQMLNINDDQIHDSYVTDTITTTTEHVLLQEVFQDPLFQQPNASLNEPASPSQQQVILDQAEIWIPPPPYDPHPEIVNGVINCVINRESDEIPDNDDINLQLYNPKARNSVNPSSVRNNMKPPLPPVRRSSLQVKSKDIIDSSGFGDCAVTTRASSSSAFSDSFTEKATSTVAATTSSTLQHFPENEICEQTLSAEMDINVPEENNIEIESDEELPSFSDLEAMILDMDLEPIGQDQYELDASKYRNEEMARKIMRLEQSAESYMNRDIAAHGAFALLYGSSKHYINKPEVLLGRATGEYPVDIDLGRSGSETRFSRRQALIKLKQDGSFEIKNLGKFSIWMNDEEINHGEVVILKNNCLIQIREKSFIFEKNEKAVKRYLDGIHK
ncbi:Forkhead-associated (FHA) domain [Arabidopsis suecica]|uniref:Forkhead-associated (FHA) domain n=1 Tax=Arabidopsis suecica TaxID=45249 RepID=A0A8T2HJC6_ARASU|nr:Forkhead-associated (FHA) domain [Arabidopsis suecica]